MTTNTSPVTFDAYDRSLELLRALVPVRKALRTVDPELLKQLRRAAQSVQLNIAEANGRVGKDRRHLFRVAYASAGETIAALQGAVASEDLPAALVAPSLALLDRLRAMTYRLATK
jgi:four helix bundle protein